MGVQCDNCSKILCDKRSLRRHRETLHNITSVKKVLNCSKCNHKDTSLVAMKSHGELNHKQEIQKLCPYCYTIFYSADEFADHMNQVHDLPVWHDYSENLPSIKASETAFDGALHVYELLVEKHVDLLELMMDRQQEINHLIHLNTQQSPRNVQFTAELTLTKPILNDDELQHITIYANSKMVPVYVDGLDNDEYFEMVEQMLSIVYNFDSHGSGWVLDKVKKLDIKIVKFSPIRASSYLALPRELANERSVLNIRNQNDEKCFFYCYTAAFHNKFGPKLLPDNAPWRQRTSPATYSAQNVNAVQPKGDFQMPMGISQISKFERINNVQVNVFRLVATF